MIAQLKYILILFIGLPVLALAQKSPGYLGKKFSLEYNAYLFPSFFNPNSPDAKPIGTNNLRQKGASLNYQHSILGQWSFSKKLSLIADIGYVNTNYIPSSYSDDRFIMSEYPSMSALSFEAGLRIYNQHFAPLGRFVEFKVGLARVSTDDFTYGFATEDFESNPRIEEHTIPGGSMAWPTVEIGFGTNRVINDILIVSYGLDFNFFPGGFGYYINAVADAPAEEFDFSIGSNSRNQEELVKMAGARYALHTAINLKIGIGILL